VKLYRKFRVAADGKPQVGHLSCMLGVRPADPANPNKYFDVPAAQGTDLVLPGGGGLSVYTDPGAIRLRAANVFLFAVDADALPNELMAVVAGDPHHLIEPRLPMTLDGYQAALARTRDLWQRI
jgi:hypothetical protein